MNRMKLPVLALVLAGAVSCGDATGPLDRCQTTALPLTGSAAAPTVVSVLLEVQPHGVVALATATDPQGTENLRDVVQSISVFRDSRCSAAPILIQDDLAGSGSEESFGTVVQASAEPALYAAISAAASWPVELLFRDNDGNQTTGRVMAAVF